ncbi:cation:proton antiporter [Halioxenophilus aromaticivorans]|uniref:Monovalent cation:proton antiporter-2 (CPA2) family protein n=1 Tax=Halioxenophilus aromaticivorans TaxID=1306992 RepID=A0AAV3U494_9ALTE
MTGYFVQAFVYLCAAVVMVPLAKRLGLGSVLGYLIAGVIIGPVTGLVGSEAEAIQHFAEFGVVMMLFLVGMELNPKTLWQMRGSLIGLGGLQLLLTCSAIFAIALMFVERWSVALAIGLIFSLSSTAIILQTFNEKGLSKTEGARNAFSVLLFQDIAVIPILSLLPLLALPELQGAGGSVEAAQHSEDLNLVKHLPAWAKATALAASIVAVVAAGYFLSRPLFYYVAKSGLPEVFTTTSLMILVGIAALMSLVGLSPALGAFLAGVVLASSEFRHELKANIEPFKGLLLGLFFITVGAGVDFPVLWQNLGLILACTLGLMALKAILLYLLGWIFGIQSYNRWLFTLSLAQAGEFGFVLLSYSQTHHVLPSDIVQPLSLVVALSMFLTPALFIVYDKVIEPRFQDKKIPEPEDEIGHKSKVIIAGIGRFGQIINRLLLANGISPVVLDHKVSTVSRLRGINIKSYYGDASRPELLTTAGIDDAKVFVVAVDDKVQALAMVKHVKTMHPNVQVLARAFDRSHQYELINAGADVVISETYKSALQLGGEVLKRLNFHAFRVEQIKQNFTRIEKQHFDSLYQSWFNEGDKVGVDEHYRSRFMEIEQILLESMQQDRSDHHHATDRGWTPPPGGFDEDRQS